MSEDTSVLIFFVNGKKIIERKPGPGWSLLCYLRRKLKLNGTKRSCGEGECGSCTVMVSFYCCKLNKIINLAVDACIFPLCAIHGCAVTTVEGIGRSTALHPTQERIAKAGGTQCGFCTPGMVMTMYTLLRNNPRPEPEELEVAFKGNLCRCTAYRAIMDGYMTFTEIEQPATNVPVCPTGGPTCCLPPPKEPDESDLEIGAEQPVSCFDKTKFSRYQPSQDPIFPPELKQMSAELHKQVLIFKDEDAIWYKPLKLQCLLELKDKYPHAKLVVGNTDLAIDGKVSKTCQCIYIQPTSIPDLQDVQLVEKGLKVGACVSLTRLEAALKEQVKTQQPHTTRIFAAMLDMIKMFGSLQIRNMASIGGSIGTSSALSDLNSIFLAANCVLEINCKEKGFRKVTMKHGFFTGHRKNALMPEDVITSITIPFTGRSQYFFVYKQSKRCCDGTAVVNAAINVSFCGEKVSDAKIAFGGMGPMTMTAPFTEKSLLEKEWNEETLEIAFDNLQQDLPLSANAPGGMVQFRRTLALSFFFKAYLAIQQQFGIQISQHYESGLTGFPYVKPRGCQFYTVISNESETDTVGCSVMHHNALRYSTGEAEYLNDLPKYEGELHLALVLSTRAHAEIISLDPKEALRMDGVLAFFSSKDLSDDQNFIGELIEDEEVFVSKKVTSLGQIIGAVVAESRCLAIKAAKKIKIQYKEITPVIISIEDAIQHETFMAKKNLEVGDVDAEFEAAENIIEGECRTGSQEHMYFEPHNCLANPVECDGLQVLTTSQNLSQIQDLVSQVIGVNKNKIVCKTRRLGGAFGGKERRAMLIALPAALAAYQLKKPVRCILDRDVDTMITGQRHPFLTRYKAAYSEEGKITAFEANIYANGGSTMDLSEKVLEKAMMHIHNCYNIANGRVNGYVCKTNLPSSTSFYGFGAPEGMFVAENIIREVAEKLEMDVTDVAKINLIKDGDATMYGQTVEGCTVESCLDECMERSSHEMKKKEIEDFNKKNRWKKRGMAAVPTLFGVGFQSPTGNQAGAFINIYSDGSVLISHNGIEMGQGIHTKMLQIAGKVLDVPREFIHIIETSTDKVPNSQVTSGMSTPDLTGQAVKDACEKLNERIRPVKDAYGDMSWPEITQQAYAENIDMSAVGHYYIPNLSYDWTSNSGQAFYYYISGAACSLVEIDCLTGDHRVLNSSVVMDVGKSINPCIDIGQIEGGFMLGYGLFTVEEMMYSPKGEIYTNTLSTYKIPGFSNVPREFNVSLLKDTSNDKVIYSSKNCSESPVFLASSVFFAIKEAIKAARRDSNVPENFQLNAPATVAQIRISCEDDISKKFKVDDSKSCGPKKPWNVIP